MKPITLGFIRPALASLEVAFPPRLLSGAYTALEPISVGHKTVRPILATVPSRNVGRCCYGALRVIGPHLGALWLHLSRAVLGARGLALEWFRSSPP